MTTDQPEPTETPDQTAALAAALAASFATWAKATSEWADGVARAFIAATSTPAPTPPAPPTEEPEAETLRVWGVHEKGSLDLVSDSGQRYRIGPNQVTEVADAWERLCLVPARNETASGWTLDEDGSVIVRGAYGDTLRLDVDAVAEIARTVTL